MSVIAPTPIAAAPPVPDSSIDEPTFDAQYAAFNSYEASTLVPGMNALASNVYGNATEAVTAASSAVAASAQAVPAAATAVAAKDLAVAAYDSFDDRYLGPKAADPTTDNDGNALLAGALYYRTSGPAGMRVWSGSVWEYSYLPAGAYLLQDFSTLTTDASIDGTEVVALSGGFKSALSALFAWFKTQANSWSGLQTFTDLRETMVTANTGTAYTINNANGTLFDLTLTGNPTYIFPTATAGKQFSIFAKQDGTGSRVTTFPSNVRWASGSAPIPTATAGRTDIYSFVADGTYWLGFLGGLNYNRS